MNKCNEVICVSEDKYNEVVCVSEEIDGVIKSLNEEMSSLELFYFKMHKTNMLKKENEELEKIIELFKKELGELETANRQRQLPIEMPMNEVTLQDENYKIEAVTDTSKNKSANSTQERETPKKENDDADIKMLMHEVTLQDENLIKELVTHISKNESANSTQERKTPKKENEKREKQSTVQKGGSSKKTAPVEEALPVDIGRLDLKVGRILEIEKHKDADTLYVEKVDIGAKQPITVVSGLVKHVPIEEMQNRRVVVLCNLKPAKMRGIISEAMVMCACTPDKLEVLTPSPSSKPGDVVTVAGYPPPPNGPEPVLNPKKKVFETLAPELLTDSECFATFRGVRWEVPGGYVKSSTLSGVNIK